MEHLEEFLTSIDWSKLQPNPSLLAEEPAGDDPGWQRIRIALGKRGVGGDSSACGRQN